jgi:hypothetical protein
MALIGVSLLAGWDTLAWVLETLLLVALSALIFGTFCLGSYVFHPHRKRGIRQANFAVGPRRVRCRRDSGEDSCPRRIDGSGRVESGGVFLAGLMKRMILKCSCQENRLTAVCSRTVKHVGRV